MTTTKPIEKAYMFRGGRITLVGLGFVIEPKPEDDDPEHFLVRPGAGHLAQGWTLEGWAATRENLINTDPTTWHSLTAILMAAAEEYRP